MTVLSVNVNKIALLRNSRGRDYPNLLDFSELILDLGVKGLTVHPRPDERHVTQADVYALSDYLAERPDVEFNIEGYPSQTFLDMVCEVKPDQCTLVPDEPGQLTSDHGWDVVRHSAQLNDVIAQLREAGIRSSLFLDPEPVLVETVSAIGCDCIELYTEAYANDFGTSRHDSTLMRYSETAATAQAQGIGVNAGHDLDLKNLADFLQIPDILEVSIGHALVVESLLQGIPAVIRQYLEITGES